MTNSTEFILGNLLSKKNVSIGIAESCTGGLISDRITNFPGASEFFRGGIIAYSYDAKVNLLNVSWDTLRQFGAVSKETVIEMARGGLVALGADIAVSVSGIAGPGGGLADKPVGTTWIGLSTSELDWARHFVWGGDRIQNKESSAEAALQFVIDYLQGTL